MPWHNRGMPSGIVLLLFIPIFASCSILNSGTVHLKYRDGTAKFNDVTYEIEENLSDLSVSIRNVQHRNEFENWDFNIRLTPSIHLDRQTFGTLETFTNERGEEEQFPTIRNRRLSSFANAKANWHTPMGQFVLTSGFGGAVYKRRSSRMNHISTTEIRKVDFVWLGFISDRVFVMLGPRYYVEQFEQFVFAFRIGMYWDEIPKRLKRPKMPIKPNPGQKVAQF